MQNPLPLLNEGPVGKGGIDSKLGSIQRLQSTLEVIGAEHTGSMERRASTSNPSLRRRRWFGKECLIGWLGKWAGWISLARVDGL